MTGKSYFPKLIQAVMDLIPTEYLMLSNCSSHGTASCDYSYRSCLKQTIFYNRATLKAYIICESLQRATAGWLLHNYMWFRLPTENKASEVWSPFCTLTAECNINENVAEEPAWKPACVVPLKKILASTHKSPETAGGMQQEVWWRKASCLCYMFSA